MEQVIEKINNKIKLVLTGISNVSESEHDLSVSQTVLNLASAIRILQTTKYFTEFKEEK